MLKRPDTDRQPLHVQPNASRSCAPMTKLFPIHIENVSVIRRERALLNQVHMTLQATGITVVLGPNGAGKSVFLRVLNGLMTPDAGCIRFSGQPAPLDTANAQALVFQRPVLLRRSAADNIAFVLRDLPAPDRRSRVADILATANLTAAADTSARHLSGGEQQRLAIARAIATDPQLLMLDEPCANLDPMATAAIETLVKAIAAENIKIILVTHDLGQARRLADDIAFFANGQLETHASAADFFTAPQSANAQLFLDGVLPVETA